jgi:hexosaminidase
MQTPFDQIRNYPGNVSMENLHKTMEKIDAAVYKLPSARSTRTDADLICREFRFAAHILEHSCRRILLALGYEDESPAELAMDIDEIVTEHEAVWLARNRPGGLPESVARFHKAKEDYL